MAKIKIDRDRIIGELNKNIFGGLLEHYGNVVYGGVVDYGHPDADQNGFRKDVLDAFRASGTPVMRWPGGNFASGYHWEDGIGPLDQRPVRFELEWQVEESNRFGTDEFIDFCRRTGIEPYICANAGSGTAEEAAHWVEYCNLKGNSHYAKLREKNGHPEPFGVKYWGLGNELYGRGQIGRKDVGQYIDCVKEFSRLMKKVDPTIKLIVVGFEKTEWNFRLIKEAGEYFDYISVHSYHLGSTQKPFEEVAALTLITAEQLYEMKCSIDSASYYIKDRKKKPIEICFDEWNLREWQHDKFIEWLTLAYDFNTNNRELTGRKSRLVGGEGISSRQEMVDFFTKVRSEDNDDSVITMADALYSAGVFNAVLRMCKSVTMGAFSPLVNGKGLFSTVNGGIVKRPTYLVFELYSRFTGKKILDTCSVTESFKVYVDSAVYNTNRYVEVPSLDAVASFDETAGKLYLAVVNNKAEAGQSNICIDGFTVKGMMIHELKSDSINSCNTVNKPDEAMIRHTQGHIHGEGLKYAFPPYSVTILEMDVE